MEATIGRFPEPTPYYGRVYCSYGMSVCIIGRLEDPLLLTFLVLCFWSRYLCLRGGGQ